MANVAALRQKIVELASDPDRQSNGRISVNDLYGRLSRHFDGDPPVSRGTFYAWFNNGQEPKQALLECVPAFAAIFGVKEYELWQAAEILPPPMHASLAIASTVHDLRSAFRQMQKTLSHNGLSSAGEALVVDRILHAKLDYRMEVWPVVRGRVKPLHLHSWIAMRPLAESESTQRRATGILEGMTPEGRREYVRHTVITDSLWRTLGLNWRDRLPPDYAHLGPSPLFIEVPVEERSRRPRPDALYPDMKIDHVLVLGAPWAHAELMAALLADALHFGSWDLRYLGLEPGRRHAEVERFCRNRLAQRRSRYVWAMAQRSDLMADLHPDIVAAAAVPRTLVVLVTYGKRLAEFAAGALRTKVDYVNEAVEQIDRLATQLVGRSDVVHVRIDDADVLGSRLPPPGESLVRDHMVDRVRHLTAGVLDHLYWHRGGPGLTQWGDRFEDLRFADEDAVDIPPGASTVRWLPRTA